MKLRLQKQDPLAAGRLVARLNSSRGELEGSARCWGAGGAGGTVATGTSLRVQASQLREGMVVVADLRSRCGSLLVAAGTRLSATSATGVGRLLGASLVDVLEPAR